MTSSPQAKTYMHCWLFASAEVGGQRYIAIRGVNFRGEYDAQRPQAPMQTPWWHVPTSKFEISPNEAPPSLEDTLTKIMPIALNEWPALRDIPVGYTEQIVPKGADPITRIAFDYGKREILPPIKLKPGEPLPYPRHPVLWLPAGDVTLMQGETSQQGNQISPYLIRGPISEPMETPEGIRRVIAKDLVLQADVGDMFVNAFGPLFPMAKDSIRPTINPDLAICGLDPR